MSRLSVNSIGRLENVANEISEAFKAYESKTNRADAEWSALHTVAENVPPAKINKDVPKKKRKKADESFNSTGVTLAQLSRLGTELRIVCDESRVRFLPDGLMCGLMPALDACIEQTVNTPFYPSGFNSAASMKSRAFCGVEAGLVTLEAISAKDMDTKIIHQTRIESIIQLCKHLFRGLICPAFDGFSRTADAAKPSSEVLSLAKEISRRVCEMLQNFQTLVEVVPLTDSVILQLTALSMNTLCINADGKTAQNPVRLLQLDSIALVQKIFQCYHQHRATIFEDIFSNVNRLPPSKKNLRAYPLIPLPLSLRSPFNDVESIPPGGGGKAVASSSSAKGEPCQKCAKAVIVNRDTIVPPEYIMMISGLVLHLVHSCAEKPLLPVAKDEDGGASSEEKPGKEGASSSSSDGDDSDSEDEETYAESVGKMKVAELRRELRGKGLKLVGKKADLQSRLIEAFRSRSGAHDSSSGSDSGSSDSEEESESESEPAIAHVDIIDPCQPFIKSFLRTLVKRCSMSDKETGYRAFLSNFVDDLIRVVCRPEWPAAEKLLRKLTSMLSSISAPCTEPRDSPAGRRKHAPVEGSFRNLAIDLIGKVCSTIQASIEHHKVFRLSMPTKMTVNVNENGVPEDDGEETACPCGRNGSTNTKQFLLDCDCCHRWFHGNCMGIERHKLPKTWYCDECQILKLLQAQSVKMRRRHEIATGSAIVSSIIMDEDEETKSARRQPAGKAKEAGNPDGAEQLDSMFLLEGGNSSTATLNRPFVLRQLILNHLNIQTYTDPAVNGARQYCLSTWYKTGKTAVEKDLYSVSWKVPKLATVREETPQLSQRANAHAALELVCEKPLFKNVGKLLDHMLKCSRDNSSSFRARTMKAISTIVDSNPDLIGDERFQMTINARFTDLSTAVREAVVVLIGKYVIRRRKYALAYHDNIVNRVRDKGVNVRKHAIRILKSILLDLKEYPRRTDITLVLSEKMNQIVELDSVKVIITDIFKELWFASAGLESISGTLAGTEFAKTTAHEIVNFVARVPSSSLEWMVNMIRASLNDKTYNNGKDRSAERALIREHLLATVAAMVDGLVHLTEENLNVFGNLFKDDMAAMVIRQAIFASLRVFAMADPSLLLPHTPVFCVYLKGDDEQDTVANNRIKSETAIILAKLLPTWNDCDRGVMKSLQEDLQNIMYRSPTVTSISGAKCWSALLCNKNCDHHLIGQTLQAFYSVLWTYRKETSLQTASFGIKGSIHRSLFQLGLLCQAYDFDMGLSPQSASTVSAPSSVSSGFATPPRRSLSPVGDYADLLPVEFGGGDLVPGHVNEQILSMYMHYLSDGCAQGGKYLARAIAGLGCLFVRRPKYMLRTGPHELISRSLTSSDADVRRVILSTLCRILQEEESKIEEAHRIAVSNRQTANFAAQVYGDQDAESSIASAVIQVHQSKFRELLLDSDANVRYSCVNLILTLLRQGLMNPLPFIVPLEVLVSDDDTTTSRLAYRAVMTIAEKAPHHVSGKFIDALSASFDFKVKYFSSTVAVTDESALDDSYTGFLSIFSRLYVSAIQPSNRFTHKFLDASLGIFRPLLHLIEKGSKPTAFSSSLSPSRYQDGASGDDSEDECEAMTNRRKEIPSARKLSYIAETLASLPYSSEEEPLFLIHSIDRMLCIHGTNTIDRANSVMRRKRSTHDRNFDIIFSGMYGLMVLFELRKHLKRVYQLPASKIQKYEPKKLSRHEITPLSKAINHYKPKFRDAKELAPTEKAKHRKITSMIGALSKVVFDVENNDKGSGNSKKRKRSGSEISPATSPVRSTLKRARAVSLEEALLGDVVV